MKRKILVVLLAIACAFSLAFGLTACKDNDGDNKNDTEQGGTNTPDNKDPNEKDPDGENQGGKNPDGEHVHDWQESYSYDDTWHYKKCNRCTEVTEKAVHVLNSAYVCDICGCEISETDGLKFTLNNDGLSYSVTGIGSVTAKTIIIPAEYNGKPVTTIGEWAFHNCTSLTSIKIPDSVTYIGILAFEGCTSLTSIKIPDGVTTIGYGAFRDCTSLESLVVSSGNKVFHSEGNCIIKTASKTLIAGCKNSIIPSDGSVTSIDWSAFEGCISLESITIPDSVTFIGAHAFSSCTSLTSVEIGDGVTSIGNNAFSSCTSLESLVISSGNAVYHSDGNCIIETASKTLIAGCKNSIIPSDGSVTSIGQYAFRDCTSLESVTIPDSVTSIGREAFSGCTSLESVIIGNGVTYIGSEAFHNCTCLTSITIGNGVTSIRAWAFWGCTSLKSITIPNSVTFIGDSAFEGCTSLESVTIGNGVTSIREWAFSGCTSLNAVYITDITSWCGISFGDNVANPLYYAHNLYLNNNFVTELAIPDSVTSIGDSAFWGCTSLTSVSIGNGVTSIGYEAFEDCNSLTSITIPDSVTSIGDEAFNNTAFYKNERNWDNGVLYISNHLIKAKTDLSGSYSIKSGTRTIAWYAFDDCSSLTSVTIPDSVTSIGHVAFEGCTSLVSVTIGNGVTSIGNCAFEGCTSLTSITIPDSVTSIGYEAFEGCTSLTNITIPDSVTYIGDSAFRDCTSLTSVIFENTSGWQRISNYSNSVIGRISSSDLANPETAARYLTDTYRSNIWERS